MRKDKYKMSAIEIEKRGGLSPKQKQDLLTTLMKEGKPLGEYNQLSVFIESGSPYIGDIKNTKVSIAISIKKNLPDGEIRCTLKAKSGKMQSKARREILIPFEYKNLGQIINFLKVFEITKGSPRFYHRWDFEIDGYFVSVKEKGYAPDHFEIETSSDNPAEVAAEEKKMEKWLQKSGLTTYTQKQYEKIMLGTFRKYPPEDLDRIDFQQAFRNS